MLARYYGRMAETEGGLMVVENSRGYVSAVFRYVVHTAPSLTGHSLWPLGQRMLQLSDLVLVNLPGGRTERAISDGAVQLAEAAACTMISVEVPLTGAGGTCAAAFRECGYRYAGTRMVRSDF